MKVKVNYTVDLEDIPALVQEILASIKRDVSNCTSQLVFNPNNFDKMVADCQAFRKKLDVVDNQLEDIMNITAGWLQAIQPESDVERPSDVEGAVNEEQN